MPKQTESGAVLITALFITAIAALLAATMAFKQHLFFSSSEGIEQWQQSYQNWQLLSAIATNKLVEQSKQAPIGYFKAIHTMQTINGQKISLTISDAQAHYNINLAENPNQQTTLTTLLLLGNPKLSLQQCLDFSRQLQSWLQSNSSGTSNNDAYYLRLKPPYYPNHADLSQLSEIKLVKGFSELKIPWLIWTKYFIALANQTKVNRYNASAEVLSALYPTLSPNQAEAYKDCLKSTNRPSSCDQQYLSSADLSATVRQTSYFLIRAIYYRKQLPALTFASLVHIQPSQNNQNAHIVWQRFSED